MAHTTQKGRANSEHQAAVQLLEEMAGCLGPPIDFIRDLTERVTGQSWEELDSAGAKAVVEGLAEALNRHLSRSTAPTTSHRAHPTDWGAAGRLTPPDTQQLMS